MRFRLALALAVALVAGATHATLAQRAADERHDALERVRLEEELVRAERSAVMLEELEHELARSHRGTGR